MTQRERLTETYGWRVVDNLELLVEHCDEAAQLVALGRDRLLSDMVVQRAAEAILNRIGDTVRNRLPDVLLEEYPGQPWRDIVAQRIRAVHAYDTLDYEFIWETFRDDIPPLREYVARTILGDDGD